MSASALRALGASALLLLAGCFGGSEPKQRADFVLLFTAQSASLDSAASRILDAAAAAAKTAPDSEVTVAGYADAVGTPQANQILSRLRAQAAADGLVERGVPRARIRLRRRSAVGGDPGAESRRVEIFIGE